jgi:predicted ATPase/class 3 adenylate cyclase
VSDAGTPIITPDQRLRVFISSTLGELAAERAAVAAAVRTLRLTPVRFELGARPHRPDDVYRSYLEQSDVFVGIYWQSYGWVGPHATISGIEDELDRSRGRPQLIYVKEPAPERDPGLRRLLDRVRTEAFASYRKFGAPGELSELVLDDLAVLLTERFHARGDERALPEGTVTFVFVDMEGSTRIAQELASSYPEIVAAFQSALARTVEDCGGVVIDTEGDGAFCVFSRVDQAASAAVSFQRALEETAWPEGAVVRARIGIHTGEAQRTADNYVGLEVHRAARIGAAANGGQILVSRTSARLLDDGEHDGWDLAGLGSFALKGLDRAEELLQLNAPGLSREPQTPRARGTRTVHLPTQLTELLGREAEISAAAKLVERHDVRLVTLTGPGGIGKTRLGMASAARIADAYPDGVYFVALADTRSTDHVVSAIAAALGIRSEGSRELLSTIEDRLASGRALLVLDNFEQVVEARPVVARLLESCPGLDLFVTSRTPLRLRGETEFAVPPLPESDAIRLFVERAGATRPGWSPTTDEAAAIADICRRLEGLPLAIELAAARLRVLDPRSLMDRLVVKLDVVGGSVPDLPQRQRTLTATIEWSYDLLEEPERILLARLAIFAGGWTVDAAEAVCGGDGVPDVLAALEGLCAQSLLIREHGATGNPRMRMLETIREFASNRLVELDEAEPLCARHASYFAELVVELRSRAAGDTAPEAMALLDDDWDDLLSCMDWLFHRERYEDLVQLLSGTWRYVWLRDRVRETTRWVGDMYTVRDRLEPQLRGELCRIWGATNYQIGNFDVAREAIDDAVRLLAEHGPLDREAWARTLRAGLLPYFDSDLSEPLAEMTRAVGLFREGANLFGLATSLGMIGTIRTFSGDAIVGAAELDEGVAAAERLGLPELVAANRTLRALGYLATEDIEAARRCLDASAVATIYLEGTAYRLEGFAAVLLATGDPIGAATALGAAEGLRERTGIHAWPIMRLVFGERLKDLRSGGPEVEAALFAGKQLGPTDALELVRSRQEPRSAATSTAALTP